MGRININTKFTMLIGTPLTQSFAARMQNAGYKASGLDMRYFYTEADSTHLKEILGGIRYMPSFIGAAITRPNKVAVMQYLDEIDPLCRKMGSCNTIVKDEQGRLVGYNTDGIGFITSIRKDASFDPADKTFFCIGAGGAGRAMCSALADAGATKIYVTDIMEESSRWLVRDINGSFAPIAEYVPFGDFAKIPECDCVMNASGIGMGSSIGTSPIPASLISPQQFCFDACYNPRHTQFLLDAEEKGCKVLNGLGMSLYQGAAQVELWSGGPAPIEIMRAELERICDELEAQHRFAQEPKSTKEALEVLHEGIIEGSELYVERKDDY